MVRFHLFKCIKNLRQKPATEIEHKAYIFISKNSGKMERRKKQRKQARKLYILLSCCIASTII